MSAGTGRARCALGAAVAGPERRGSPCACRRVHPLHGPCRGRVGAARGSRGRVDRGPCAAIGGRVVERAGPRARGGRADRGPADCVRSRRRRVLRGLAGRVGAPGAADAAGAGLARLARRHLYRGPRQPAGRLDPRQSPVRGGRCCCSYWARGSCSHRSQSISRVESRGLPHDGGFVDFGIRIDRELPIAQLPIIR